MKLFSPQALIVLGLLVGACSFDSAGGTGDDESDASVVVPDSGSGVVDAAAVDAATPDAGPACTSNAECATPPTLCQLAGTCDMAVGRCVFPSVDCTGDSDECNVGSCEPATGACVKIPSFESNPCGAVTECGAFADCGGFDVADACDESGSQSRDCTDFSCAIGACVGAARVDTQVCERDQDGVTCADTACPGAFGACQFAEFCDHDGTRSRDCTANTCLDATCTATPIVQVQDCSRGVRDGQECADPDCGDFTACGFEAGNLCDDTGLRVRVCTPFECSAQICEAGTLFSDEVSCTRNTDDVVCGEVCEMGPPPTCVDITCDGGDCPVD